MTAEKQSSQLRQNLITMGYKEQDANCVVNAGITEIDIAIDFLSTASASSSTSRQPVPSSDATSRGQSKARDSLDRNDFHRNQPSIPAATAQLVDGSDDNLRRALLLSQKEQEERDTPEALKRSKEQNSAHTDQDPDLRLAIEESLKDNPSCGQNDCNVSWQSNPVSDIQQRIRSDPNQPVGLRNIGNTCYLNSLLQVYYHLPEFRKAIMKFRPPEQSAQISIAPPDTLSNLKPFADVPADGASCELSRKDRLEPELAESQPDQSFPAQPNGGEFKNPPEGISGMSYNYTENEDTTSPIQHAVQFVIKLQKLFASMALGI